MVEVMKIMAASFKRSHAHTATLSAPDPTAGHHQSVPLPDTPGHSWASLGQSLVGVIAPFSWIPVHTRFCLCPLESVSPVLCKFCNQIPLASKVKFPGSSQFIGRSPGWEICAGS